jgi:hypothetical protein
VPPIIAPLPHQSKPGGLDISRQHPCNSIILF